MRQVVAYLIASHGYSQRRACRLTRLGRSTQRCISRRDPRTALRQRMHELVSTRVRYGYQRVHVMLRRAGWKVGRNVVYRLYREEGLALRSKRPRRRKMVVHREARCQPKTCNEAWSLDFIHDQLSNGEKFRALTGLGIRRPRLAPDRSVDDPAFSRPGPCSWVPRSLFQCFKFPALNPAGIVLTCGNTSELVGFRGRLAKSPTKSLLNSLLAGNPA